MGKKFKIFGYIENSPFLTYNFTEKSKIIELFCNTDSSIYDNQE